MTAHAREMLWERLRASELVEGELPARQEDGAPWFVRVMLGFAGWLGALFLLAFMGAAFARVLEHAMAALTIGAGACIGASALYRAGRGDFSSQFAFAISLAGQALLALGFYHLLGGRSFSSVAAIVAVQQAVLFWLVPSFSHRVWCAWTAAYAAQHALANVGLASLTPALLTAGVAAVWLREFEHARHGAGLRAAGYGLVLASISATAMHGGLRDAVLPVMGASAGPARSVAWLGAAASAGVLVGTVVALLRREAVALGSRRGSATVAATLILAVASFKAPGLAPAIVILVIGYANGSRLLTGAGIAGLAAYLSYYYYSLESTLLEKAALLFFTGLALLGVRMALRRWWRSSAARDA